MRNFSDNTGGFGLPRLRIVLGGRWTYLTGGIAFICAILFIYGYANRIPEETLTFSDYSYETYDLYGTLGLNSSAVLKFQFWRFFSSVLLHATIMQLVCTILLLYFFGSYLQQRLGKIFFLFSFLFCGIAGGVVSLIISPTQLILCASAAVLGVSTLCVCYFPYLRFFGSLTARAMLFPAIMLTLLASATFTESDLLLLGHLAGVVAGYLFYKVEPYAQSVISRYKLRREISGLFSEAKKEEDLDRILNKVSNSGIDSLSRRERRFLQSMSKEYQKKKTE